MIDNKSMDASIGLAERMSNAGVTLTTVDGSAMEHILGSMSFISIKPEDGDQLREAVKAAANNEEHDGTLGIPADLAANSVLNTHRLVTDVVNPHIRHVMERVNAAVAELDDKSTKIEFPVKFLQLDPVLNNESLINAIRSVAEDDLHPSRMINLGEYGREEILDLVKFSNTDNYDTTLAMELSSGDAIEDIQSVLEGRRNPEGANNWGARVWVALFLLGQSLRHSDIIKEGVEVSLVEYRNRLQWLSVFSARKLLEIYRSTDGMFRNKILYGDTSEDGTITIVGPTLQTLAEHGVTVEHLIGNYLLDQKYLFHDFVKKEDSDNSAALEESINRYNSVVKSRRATADAEYQKLLIQTVLSTINNDVRESSNDPDRLAMLNDTPQSLVTRSTKVCENVYESGRKLTKDVLSEFVAGVIISIYYAHTDALLYLDFIADSAKEFPDLEPAALAKIARANLLVHWIYRQLAVVK